MSIEYDTSSTRGGTTRNVQLIGNTVIGVRSRSGDPGRDLFITAPGAWQVWGNKYYHRGSIGPDTATVRVDGFAHSAGYSLDTPTVRWHDTKFLSAATPGDSMFVVQNDFFHTVAKTYGSNPDTWNYGTYDGPFSGVKAIAADNNRVFAMIGDTLSRLTPGSPYSWSRSSSATNWSGFEAMTMSAGQIYVVKSGYLYHVDPNTLSNSSPSPIPGGKVHKRSLASTEGSS